MKLNIDGCEKVNAHRGDASLSEKELAHYLIIYGAEALKEIREAGLNRGILMNEGCYQIMKACEELDGRGELPSDDGAFIAIQRHLSELPLSDLRVEGNGYDTLYEAIGAKELIFDAMKRRDNRLPSAMIKLNVFYIGDAHKNKAIMILVRDMVTAMAKPGLDLCRVMEKVGEEAKLIRVQTAKDVGMTIDDATGDALTLHDFMRDQAKANKIRPNFGLKALDEAFYIMPGTYTCLMGSPGSGKTTLAMQLAIRSAKNDLNVHFVSWEMTSAQLGAKRISCETGLDVGRIQSGTLGDDGTTDRKLAGEFAECKNIEIVFDGDTTTKWLGDHLAKLATRSRKPDLVIIDHLHFMTCMGGQKEFEMLQQASKLIAQFCRKTNVPVVALIQMKTTSIEEAKDRKGTITAVKEPSMSDIRGSGSIAQDMSGLLMLWPQDLKGLQPTITVKIGKNRYGDVGLIDTTFDKPRSRFTNARAYKKKVTSVVNYDGDNDKPTPPRNEENKFLTNKNKTAQQKKEEALDSGKKQHDRLSANEIYRKEPSKNEDLFAQ